LILQPGVDKKHLELTLLEFAYAEYGSALEMLAASKRMKSDKLKLGYIRHAFDEYRHTKLLLIVLRNLLRSNPPQNARKFKFQSKNVINKGYLDKKGFLVEKLQIRHFIEFVYTNEFLAKESFEILKKRVNDRETHAVLDSIIAEEDEHAHGSISKLDAIMVDEDRHWGYAKSFYERHYSPIRLKIAFKREKTKNRLRLFYLRNLKLVGLVLDPLVNLVINFGGGIVKHLEIAEEKNTNLMQMKSDRVL
jgi:hypothetical protein